MCVSLINFVVFFQVVGPNKEFSNVTSHIVLKDKLATRVKLLKFINVKHFIL